MNFRGLDRRKRALSNRKRAFWNTHFQNTALHVLLFSIRQRFGLRAKNARAENPLVNNGVQQNGETGLRFGMRAQNAAF